MALTQIKSTSLVPQAVGWVHIATVTASDSASVALEDSGTPDCGAAFDGTYNELMIKMSNVQTATDDVILRFTFEFGGSYGADTYQYHMAKMASGSASYGADRSDDQSVMEWTKNSGTGSGESLQATMYFSAPDGTDNTKGCYWIGSMYTKTPSTQVILGAGYRTEHQQAFTGIKFDASSGNIEKGVFTIYGLTKAQRNKK